MGIGSFNVFLFYISGTDFIPCNPCLIMFSFYFQISNQPEQVNSLPHTLDIVDAEQSLVVLLPERTLLHVGGDVSEHSGEHLALVERTVYIAHKLHLHVSALQHNLLASQALAHTAKAHHVHQFLAWLRHRSESVYQSLAVSLHLVVGLQVV